MGSGDTPDDERTTQPRAGGDDIGAGPPSSTRMLDSPNKILAGRYRIIRSIGRGGMGEVYEALDIRRNDLRVAVKCMFAADPRGISRLKREFRRMEGIAHPNLVAMYGLDVHEGRPFIIMEYIEGREFYAALGPPPVDATRLRALVRPLVHGVMALHEARRVHRDLKSSNVLVSTQGRVVVLDFGLVNEFERRTVLTSSLGAAGTPVYMAPEQAAGQLSTPASDWYALGVMLYYAISGHYPLTGSTYQILWAKQQADMPHVREVAPYVSPHLDELITRLLQREPARRATGFDVLAFFDRLAVPARRPLVRPPLLDPLIGREPQKRALASALARSAQTGPTRIDIVGASGTGKSALLRQFLAPLKQDPGYVVLSGRCYENDNIPFKAFDLLIEEIVRFLLKIPSEQRQPLLGGGFHSIACLFPALRRVQDDNGTDAMIARLGLGDEEPRPQERREQALVGLRGLLYRLAAGARLVLAIDDLQWGDLDSVRLCRELIADRALPLLFVLAYREEDVARSVVLQELVTAHPTASRSEPIVLVRTEPLAREEAILLANRLLGGAPRARAEWLADEAQGNPMLIDALARHLGDMTLDEPNPRETLVRRRLSLEDLVARRLASLAPEAGRLLRALALLGQPERFELVAHAADVHGDPRGALAQLRALHLVCTSVVDGIDFVESYHQRIARAVAQRLSPDELAAQHRRIAEVLTDAGSEEHERLFSHWFAANEIGRAGELAAEAADLAFRTCAFESAIRLFTLAQTCRPSDRTLPRKLASALVAAGRAAEAAPLLLDAARSSPPKLARTLQYRAGELWIVSGDLARGLKVLRPLLADHGLTYPEQHAAAGQLAPLLAALAARGVAWTERSTMELSRRELEHVDLCWVLCKGHILTDFNRGGLFAVQTALLALDLGEPRRIAPSLALAGAVALERGDPKGRGWLKEAADIAHRIGDAYAIGFVALCWGVVHRGAGAWAQAVENFEFGLTRLSADSVWEYSFASASLLASLEALGELPLLAQRSEQFARTARNNGDWRMSCLGQSYAALTALAADDVPGSRALLAAAWKRLATEAFQITHLHALKVAIDCDLYTGDVVGAWRRISESWSTIERSSLMDNGLRRSMALGLRARAGLALCASKTSGYDFVAEIVAQDAAQIESERTADARALAALLRAGLARLAGDDAEIRRCLWTAVADFDSTARALHATCARRCLATWGCTAQERDLRGSAENFMRLQGIARPDRWTAVLAPGLLPIDDRSDLSRP